MPTEKTTHELDLTITYEHRTIFSWALAVVFVNFNTNYYKQLCFNYATCLSKSNIVNLLLSLMAAALWRGCMGGSRSHYVRSQLANFRELVATIGIDCRAKFNPDRFIYRALKQNNILGCPKQGIGRGQVYNMQRASLPKKQRITYTPSYRYMIAAVNRNLPKLSPYTTSKKLARMMHVSYVLYALTTTPIRPWRGIAW